MVKYLSRTQIANYCLVLLGTLELNFAHISICQPHILLFRSIENCIIKVLQSFMNKVYCCMYRYLQFIDVLIHYHTWFNHFYYLFICAFHSMKSYLNSTNIKFEFFERRSNTFMRNKSWETWNYNYLAACWYCNWKCSMKSWLHLSTFLLNLFTKKGNYCWFIWLVVACNNCCFPI